MWCFYYFFMSFLIKLLKHLNCVKHRPPPHIHTQNTDKSDEKNLKKYNFTLWLELCLWRKLKSDDIIPK